jgi:hypothetical protein
VKREVAGELDMAVLSASEVKTGSQNCGVRGGERLGRWEVRDTCEVKK